MPSAEAKRYLLAQYGERNQITLEGGRKAPMAPGRQAVGEAFDQLEAMAYSGGRRGAPALRVGGDGARIVLDLCRDDYSVVVVENGGWSVVKPSPLAMRRAPGMQPLPLPVQGAGDALGDLRRLLNFDAVEHASFWALFVGFMFASLRPVLPYFVLCVAGDQGTGKSTTAKISRLPIDPHDTDTQPKPKSEDDLFVNADGQWLVIYDNLSTLDQHWSDAFCRISTGTGYSKRKLCTDRDTARFKVARPQILTSIVDVAGAPDLLDRALLAPQPKIGDPTAEEELFAAATELAPRVLGQLLDAAAVALQRQRKIKLHTVPRIVGPTKWIEAGAEVLGLAPDQFLDAYLDSRERAGELAIEASVVGRHLIAMLAIRAAASDEPAGFSSTSTMLLGELDGFMRMSGRARPQGWPNTPHGMGRALHRIAPALRKLGYGVTFERTAGTGERVITITPPPARVDARDISDISDVSIPTPTGGAGVFVEQKSSSHPAGSENKRHKRHKRHTRPNGPEPGTVASGPFMITLQMRADLKARGFTDAQIRKMTPGQAHAHLAEAPWE
jgi:hypothetical protein